MPKLFISYRRNDSAYPSHAIYRHLAEHYGTNSVIFDVDSIPLGVDFVEFLSEQVSQCDALLAIIGGGWVDARSEDGTRRLDDPDDFVRIEVQTALKLNIPVIPVLVDRASMPSADDLPHSLKPLSRRNAAEVRSGRDFQGHLELLVRGLEQVFEYAEATSREKEKASTPQIHQQSTDSAQPVNTSAPTRTKSSKATEKTEGISPRAIESSDVATNSIDMQLKLISAGEFLMGASDSDKDACDNEKPQHRVRIPKPFYLGAYTVTQQEYERVMGDNPARYKGEGQRPVETVSWHDALKFCNKLSNLDGLDQYYKVNSQNVSVIGGTGYRLPTEAEWEYACRSGTTTRWSCGDTETGVEGIAWFLNNADSQTRAVGTLQPNGFGLYDMHGNVWEWCHDAYASYPSGDTTDEVAQGIADNEDVRVLRGGSFISQPQMVRSPHRNMARPTYSSGYIGMRVARTLP